MWKVSIVQELFQKLFFDKLGTWALLRKVLGLLHIYCFVHKHITHSHATTRSNFGMSVMSKGTFARCRAGDWILQLKTALTPEPQLPAKHDGADSDQLCNLKESDELQ